MRVSRSTLLGLCALLGLASCAQARSAPVPHAHAHAHAQAHHAKLAVAPGKTRAKTTAQPKPARAPQDGVAEARLIEVYKLIGQQDMALALKKAEQLTREYPTFGLAQLVYADLLSARMRPVRALGDVPQELPPQAEQTLRDLRAESHARLKALRERPPAGAVPSAFVQLSPLIKHAIAVDASRSRLYLFENRPSGPVLVDDYYISVGKAGTQKKVEGDARTPLGVYYITSQISRHNLKDYYGAGALPLNYPNALDQRRGQTGSGIWLHGTPSNQFSRAPQASDGCVVLANPDFERIMHTVAVRSTPVVIAAQLHWVKPQAANEPAHGFMPRLQAWLRAKSSGNLAELGQFYSPDFNSDGQNLSQWMTRLAQDVKTLQGREAQIKDLSLLHWKDSEDVLVVSFGELAAGQRSGVSRRQYWLHHGNQWKIFYEGVIG
jgi:hypothetical protein